jgi:hypothetical protein
MSTAATLTDLLARSTLPAHNRNEEVALGAVKPPIKACTSSGSAEPSPLTEQIRRESSGDLDLPDELGVLATFT